ncbi:hypothetical protein HMH01_14610 [Halovulum dunhuangense]|uniref:DUF5602 domain-containing protein n=1 Tax=Halovulum dunhuangense TaxID=1505036 RepID=A0A849L5L6_9RHOB|nr:hypothetical protein [Halovulum dunhuangense]NNU81669.1 hypothetical protein [Halovulum dunhuangense]
MNIARQIALAATASVGLTSAVAAEEIVRGAEVAFGAGTAHSWALLDSQNRPQEIGVSMSADAVATLGNDMIFVTLPLPERAIEAGYGHVSLDWMPHGHHPDGLFGVPHFDVHFYFTSEADRLAIDPADPAYMTRAANYPDRIFMPADYAPPPQPDPVPAMGEHWLDTTHPIFSGAPFDHVFIYGSWDGAVTFVEPMVSLDVIASRQPITAEVKQPEAVARTGWYPTRYTISYDPKTDTHDVALGGLVLREPHAQRAALRN